MKIFISKTFYFVNFLIAASIINYSQTIHAGESDTYDFSWLDPDKEVFVLQNRRYRKNGKIHFSLGAGITTSGPFVDALSFQGRVGYFFKEDFGVEFLYSKNSGEENSTAEAVRNPGGAGSVPFRRIVQNYKGAMLLWSPFYAKINTFNKIIYFDWIFGLGYAQMDEKNNRDEVEKGGAGIFSDIEATQNCIMWGTALKFYVGSSFDIRLDLTTLNYQDRNALNSSTSSTEGWNSNFDLTLALGYNF